MTDRFAAGLLVGIVVGFIATRLLFGSIAPLANAYTSGYAEALHDVVCAKTWRDALTPADSLHIILAGECPVASP